MPSKSRLTAGTFSSVVDPGHLAACNLQHLLYYKLVARLIYSLGA